MVCTALLIPACSDSDDPKPGPVTPIPTSPYENLIEKEHVLTNLVNSYIWRNATEYERLLDKEKYTFFFSTGDVGGQIPAQWGLVEDLLATQNLLDPNYSGAKRVISIDLALIYDTQQWVPFQGDGGEIWWAVTVLYSFNIKTADDFTYLSDQGTRAQFIVRNVGTTEAPQWRLVQWMDLGSSRKIQRTATVVEDTSWGRVKALYTN